MRNADPVRLADIKPPTNLPADVQHAWRRLAPLVDRSGVVVLPHHVPFAYRALCEAVALRRLARLPVTDVCWLPIFGITAAQVEQAL